MNSTQIHQNERGGATTFFMLFCLLAILGYLRGGRALLLEHYSNETHLLLLAVLGVITFFTIGCQLHMILKGEESPRQIRRSIKRQLKELSIVTKAALERLEEAHDTLSWQSRVVRPIAFEHASRAQELIARLIHRGKEVESLLRRRNKAQLFAAAELMGAPLTAFQNCQDALIQARPLPTLLPEQWIPTLEQLLQAVEFEVDRAENRLRTTSSVQ